MTTEKFVGEEYKKHGSLDVVEIAKLVRQDIKDLVKAKVLPKGISVSVKTSRYSMGQSIKLKVQKLPETHMIVNSAWVRETDANPHNPNSVRRYSNIGMELLDILEKTLNEYNRKDIDMMSDYCNVHFHDSVGFADGLWQAQVEQIRAWMESEKEVKEDLEEDPPNNLLALPVAKPDPVVKKDLYSCVACGNLGRLEPGFTICPDCFDSIRAADVLDHVWIMHSSSEFVCKHFYNKKLSLEETDAMINMAFGLDSPDGITVEVRFVFKQSGAFEGIVKKNHESDDTPCLNWFKSHKDMCSKHPKVDAWVKAQ
jgi:hypothetical protein